MRECLDDRRLTQARLYRAQLSHGMAAAEPAAWLSQLVLEIEREEASKRAQERGR